MTKRLWIGGPTRDNVPASFAMDLAQLYRHASQHMPTVLGFVGATYVHVGREVVVKAAYQHQATHLLWLDSDMRFPTETALRLLAHDQPIVGANYVMRAANPVFTAMKDGKRVETLPYSTGLEEVDVIGMGVLLMRMDVLDVLQKPFFTHGINEDGGDIGEDVMFCRALQDAGHRIYVDHDLSKEVGHIGQFTFGIPTGEPVGV